MDNQSDFYEGRGFKLRKVHSGVTGFFSVHLLDADADDELIFMTKPLNEVAADEAAELARIIIALDA